MKATVLAASALLTAFSAQAQQQASNDASAIEHGTGTPLSDVQGSLHLRMYPVPTNGYVTAECPQGMLKIEVRDVDARLVMHRSDLNGEQRFSFDIVQPGTYKVKVVDREGRTQDSYFIRSNDKVVVEHSTDAATELAEHGHEEGAATAFSDERSSSNLRMTPWVTSGYVTAECPQGMVKIEVKDDNNRVVMRNSDLNGEQRFSFDIVQPGIYMVDVIDRDGHPQRSRFTRTKEDVVAPHSTDAATELAEHGHEEGAATPARDVQSGSSLRMTPWETSGFVTAECPQGMLKIEVRDINGRVVMRNSDLNGEQRFSFDIVQPGSYMVDVIDRDGKPQRSRFTRTKGGMVATRTTAIPSEQAEPTLDEGAATPVLETQGGLHLRMYPVPTFGTVTADCPQGMVKIEVRDLNGRLVMRNSDLNGVQRFSFDINEPGTYMVDVLDRDGKMQRSRFIRSRQ